MRTTRSWAPRTRQGLAVLAAVLGLCLPATAGSSGVLGADALANTAAADSGQSLTRGAGFDRPHGSPAVRKIQRRLSAAGAQPGPVDGLFGPLTEAAVRRFQQSRGLAVDGIAGPQTMRQLERAGRSAPVLTRGAGFERPHGSSAVRKLQRRLRVTGAQPGPVDGLFGPLTEAAVTRFQQSRGLAVDGIAGPRTMRKLSAAARRVSASKKPERQAAQAAAEDAKRAAEDGQVTGEDARATEMPRLARRQRAAPASTPNGEEDAGLDLALLIALLVTGALAVAAIRSGSRLWRTVTPIAPELMAAGHARSPAIGEFEGRVLAVEVMRPWARQPALRCLVADPRHPIPFWLDRDEIEVFRGPAGWPIAGAAPLGRDVRALGYVSEPESDPDADSADHTSEIERLCSAWGWTLVDVVRDHEAPNCKGLRRPGVSNAFRRIARGDASCLVVADLRHVTRSTVEVGDMLRWLSTHDARLVCLNPQLDTGVGEGRLAANALVSVAGWERETLAERTRQGLAAARARGHPIGRPSVKDRPELRERIVAMRQRGMTLQAIADALNSEKVPTLRGGSEWRPSSVQSVVGYRRPRRKHPLDGFPAEDGPPQGAAGTGDPRKEADR
jgi:peptidoglycan hydrolase-like protein with peptidoglycan-binding domain/DNA invertase Pin-like site-specific DNA recombinase